MMHRRKGAKGELQIAGVIRDLTGWSITRRVRQHEGDSDLTGIPGWSAEVKFHEKAGRGDIARWWQQAVDQTPDGERTVLFYRPNYARSWRAVWSVCEMLTSPWPANWTGYEWTCETSVEAWAAAAREFHCEDNGC